jgi:PD-(D/E)XK nuclease superfamily protein
MNQESRKTGKDLRNSEITQNIIAAAIRVHRELGPGFLVEGKIIVELKAISELEDIHFAIGRSYLKATNLDDGLLLNFATIPLAIKRFCRERRSNDFAPDLLA